MGFIRNYLSPLIIVLLLGLVFFQYRYFRHEIMGLYVDNSHLKDSLNSATQQMAALTRDYDSLHRELMHTRQHYIRFQFQLDSVFDGQIRSVRSTQMAVRYLLNQQPNLMNDPLDSLQPIPPSDNIK